MGLFVTLIPAVWLLLSTTISSTAEVVPGGPRQLSQRELREEMHQGALKEAVQDYNKKSNSAQHYVLYNVEEATSQVVAGMKINYTILLVPSACRKQDPMEHKTLKECQIGQGHAERCQVTLHVQPWLLHGAPRQVLSSKCERADTVELHDNLFHVGVNEDTVGSLKEFEFFLSEHNKQLSTVEFQKRFKLFKSNMKKAALMQLMELGSGKYGITPFSDLSEEEFQQQRLTPAWDLSKRPENEAPEVDSSNDADAPASFDWRDKGAVTDVKNQGQCGSCWAFSTTGNVEGQWFVKKGKLISLSEQELVDCDKVDFGCNGGLPSHAYKEIVRLGGLMTEQAYPYSAAKGTCRFQAPQAVVYVNGSVGISQNEGQMATWLASNGPISIGINAKAMQHYTGGISHPWGITCNKHELNHGVLIVGYGTSDTKEPYWIVKNSWGPAWGTKGYYYVYRGDGTCGLNTMCTSAVIN